MSDLRPVRVETMPNAVYWTASKMVDATALVAGAYLVVHDHPVWGAILILLAVLD